MTEPAPTTVVVESSDNQLLARCLEGVLSGLGREDRVVVVADDPGRARKIVSGRRSVSLVDHPRGGLGQLIASLAQDASRLVLVTEDAIITQRQWLTLLATHARAHPDALIAATTNAAPWPLSLADVPEATAPRREVRDVAQRCGHDRRGQCEPVGAVGGPVVSVHATAAHQLASSAASSLRHLMADLAAGAAEQFVARDVYVHGTIGVPLVSCCLIVKDEADDLAACLETVSELADEVIVYDTGSTDATVSIARAAGAIVIEGDWHDDFARARNAALDAARGSWVLSIDADERLEIDPGAAANLRTLLRTSPPVDRYIIALHDLLGSVHAPVRGEDGKPMARLFRRARCRWVGAIHEQPDARPNTPEVRSEWLAGVRFLHRGYLDEVVAEKDKWARNLRVAAAGFQSVPEDGKGCFDLARSLQSMGYRAEALSLFDRAAELDDNPVITRAALQFEIQTLLEIGNHEDAESELQRLRDCSDTPNVARYLEGWLRVEQGRWDDALACLEGLTDYNDTFTSYTEDRRLGALALALRGLERRSEAAHAAALALGHNPQSNHGWLVLLDTEDTVPGLLAQAAAAVPNDRLLPAFVTLERFGVGAQDRVADALIDARPGDLTALAMASRFAAQLPAQRVATWAGRLRAAGLGSLCPLSAIANDGTRTVAERAEIVAAGLHELGADDLGADLVPLLDHLVERVLDDEVEPLGERILGGPIGAAETFIIAAATTATRSLALVCPLVSHGHLTEALAVLDHAAGLESGAAQRWAAQHHHIAAQLQLAASQLGRDDLYPLLQSAA